MKIIKPIILSIVAVAIAVVSGVASYIITANILKKDADLPDVTPVVSNTPTSVSAQENDGEDAEEEETKGEENSPGFKYYHVRLEGDKLNVYVNYEEHEELLYGERINLNDLSDEDKEILTNGKQFEKMSELTEFTENFTS